ncbi:F0F1 ATP synthase subunit delta [Comamonas flocculans]|uniref:ATP synthase subunit delta n=1 Tax=Comamonas flocculans TaxID=2597701 RepID=A0A5B8RXB6_9BURK|nr:F0F1 ATP synthase subunit delta [Comamonas flocculans]QEA12457.1 F0F1 ATP synthase subunit delta [Comamonas flocculans]
MAELATIARPYAEALFKACSSQKADFAAAVQWLDELAAIAANPQLLQMAESPKVTASQILEIMTGVARSKLPASATNLLTAVVENGRLRVLPEIAAQFRALVNQTAGSSDALVVSAFDLSPQQLQELGVTLEKRFGRKLNLSLSVDPSLIGGVRVVVGDEVLDTSVKARLEQMKATLLA